MTDRTKTRTNSRERRSRLVKVRKAMMESLHDLSEVSCNDQIAEGSPPLTDFEAEALRSVGLPAAGMPRNELQAAVECMTNAIQAVNCDLARKDEPEAAAPGAVVITIEKARKFIADAFEADPDWRRSYIDNVAMLLHDKYDIMDHKTRNVAADDILNLIFGSGS